jgi:sialate O-acetylesterase
MKRIFFLLISIFVITPFFSSLNCAPIRLPTLFGSNMVLQRNTNPAIWGWASPKSRVNIQFAGITTSATVNENGKWFARLPQSEAGGPFVMKIYSRERDTLTFENVMIGEVWLASGQSNMQWAIGWGIDNKDDVINTINNPGIRFFTVGDDLNNHPQDDISGGKWEECNSANAPGFSAAAYFFARELQNQLKVTVGIIHSSWGGTNIEAWMSSESLENQPGFADSLKEINLKTGNFENGYETFRAINDQRDSIIINSHSGIEQKVFDPGYIDSDWKTMVLPCKWSDYGLKNYYGYCWFRKKIDIPLAAKNKELRLSLGEICCDDVCYFNGIKITKNNNNPELSFTIPASMVKEGENFISLQILGRWGVGGFNSPGNKIFIESNDGSFHLSLSNEWKYNEKIEPSTPEWNEYYNYPSFVHNAKIAPIIPYSIKGIIWYQGENNTSRSDQYRSFFPALINDWRNRWGQANLPFIFAQLANYGARTEKPSESKTANLREAQSEALKIPNTAMTVNIDLGKADGDVHFKNKQECGKRFALAALGLAYCENIEFSGPLYKSMSVEGNKIRIRFSNSDSGLKTKNDEAIKSIAIAGKDKIFVWAQAKIEANELVVWSDKIDEPVAVRYGWADNPDCNLYNGSGLPAAPFRAQR